MAPVSDGVARYPFGLDCRVINHRIHIYGFGVLYFEFSELGDLEYQVAQENHQVLLLVSSEPAKDDNLDVRSMDMRNLWAALVGVSQFTSDRD